MRNRPALGLTFSAACASLAAVSTVFAPAAGAQDLPDPPPYVPDDSVFSAFPGSYDYTYNVIAVGPPPTTDSRGTNVSATVDSAMSAVGLPGSKLGNGGPNDQGWVSSNAMYGISAGMAPSGQPVGGVNIGAGVSGLASESATGAPPQSPTPVESVMPTDTGGYPSPVLETPGNPRLGVEGVDVPLA
ncbi:MAG: hypothetical protein SW019_25890 [Actinomycetota bacterium]|nr:hypothetical protein [Actinomycetota bacterium]